MNAEYDIGLSYCLGYILFCNSTGCRKDTKSFQEYMLRCYSLHLCHGGPVVNIHVLHIYTSLFFGHSMIATLHDEYVLNWFYIHSIGPTL